MKSLKPSYIDPSSKTWCSFFLIILLIIYWFFNIIFNLENFHGFGCFLKFFILHIELLGLLVRKDEIERKLVIVKIVNHVPENLFVLISHLRHVYLKILSLKEQNLDPLVKLGSTNKYRTFLFIRPF
jgi:hypothetical protein